MLTSAFLVSFLSFPVAQQTAPVPLPDEEFRYARAPQRPASETEVLDALATWEDDDVYRSSAGGLRVNVMPSTFSDTDGNLKPASWVGRSHILWGNAQGGTLPYSWSWSFGDGSPAVVGVAVSGSDARYIRARHAYATQGPKLAVLTVTDAVGATDSDVVRVDVAPKALDTQVQAAIEDGLRYLYLIQASGGTFPVTAGADGLIATAFQLRGHFKDNDPDQDIYADTLTRYWNTIWPRTLHMTISAVGEPGPPDTNGNGYGLYFNGYTSAYQHGIMMLALASIDVAADLSDVVPAGSEAGRTIRDVLQDVLDLATYSQTNANGGAQRGGWRYEVRTGSYGSDNSAVQWPVLGMIAAENPAIALAVPPHVKTELQIWTNYSQDASGAFGYTSVSYFNNMAKTGAGLIQLAWLGFPYSSTQVQAALGYLNSRWAAPSDSLNYVEQFNNNLYAMYAIKKGMEEFLDEDPGASMIGTHAWQDEYDRTLVDDSENQYDGTGGIAFNNDAMEQDIAGNDFNDGRWPGGQWFGSHGGTGAQTAAGVLILLRGVIDCVPVAECLVYPDEVGPGDLVTMDASGSYHECADQGIVDYRWDFDASDGVTFEPGDASGIVATTSYSLAPGETSRAFIVTLRVGDDRDPQRQRFHQCSVSVSIGTNHAPVALAGGPYSACVGEPILLDGSASFDPDQDEGDFVAEYRWDLDGDGQYDDFDGVSTTVTFPGLYDGFVSLQVEDSHGAISTNSNARVRIFTALGDLNTGPGDVEIVSDEGCLAGSTVCVRGSYRVLSDDAGFVVPSARVDFYLDDPNEPANRFASFTDTDLADGMVVTHEACFARTDAREHTVVMVIDPNQAVNECVETDNSVELELACDCCIDEDGKQRQLEAMILQYTGDKCEASSHHQDTALVECRDPLLGPLPDRVLVVVGSKPCGGARPANPLAAQPSGPGFTSQLVSLGQEFIVGAAEMGRRSFGENTWVCIVDHITGKTLQSVKIVTSCAEPLFHGDQFGSIRIVDCQGAPLIVSDPVLTGTTGSAYAYPVKALDSGGDDGRLSYSLLSRPAGMSIDPLGGVISWTPSSSQEGSHGVVVRAEDPDGLTDEQSFSVSIVPGP